MYERRFLNEVDLSKGEIQRTVTLMVTLKESLIGFLLKDTDTVAVKKPERKEFLWYQNGGRRKSWRDIAIMPVSHTMGYYTKQFTRPVIDQSTGEVSYMTLDPSKAQTIYYIPFSTKKGKRNHREVYQIR